LVILSPAVPNDDKQLPPPPQPFGGRIERNAAMTDDTGFGPLRKASLLLLGSLVVFGESGPVSNCDGVQLGASGLL
jgi:hypothetical protein